MNGSDNEGTDNAYLKGMAGEGIAVGYLRSRGFRILARNYRYRRAEIDVLAVCGNTLAVVEVKTRSRSACDSLSDSITRAKMGRLVMAADHFVRCRQLDVTVRFDVIQIRWEPGRYQVEHLENAFYPF